MLEERAEVSCVVRPGEDSWLIRPPETSRPEFQGLIQGHAAAGGPQQGSISGRLMGGGAVRATDPGGGEATESWLVGGPGGGGGPGQHPWAGPAAPEVREASSPKHGTLFPFEWGAKVINTRGGRAGGWGRNPGRARRQERAYLLPAPGLGEAAEAEPRTHLWTAGRTADRHSPGRPGAAGSPADGASENPNLRRGVTWGPRAEPRAGGGRERSGSALAQEAQSAAHPARRERCGYRQLGRGLPALDPRGDPAAASPPPR